MFEEVVSGLTSAQPEMHEKMYEKMRAEFWTQLEVRRAELAEKFGEKYPEAEIDDAFVFEYGRAEKDCGKCGECKGLPCSKKFFPNLQFQVSSFGRRLYLSWYRCKYTAAKVKENKAAKVLEASKIPALYVGKTFEDYEVDAENEGAVTWAKKIVSENSGQSLFISGNVGTGKTFLAAIIAQELMKLGRSVIFQAVPKLLDNLRDSYDEKSEVKMDKLISELEKVDVLVLDDLGTEVSTEWAVERLFLILNERYQEEKQTLITSNYSLSELAERLNNPKKAQKRGVSGDRIASRIKEMCKRTVLKGADRRL